MVFISNMEIPKCCEDCPCTQESVTGDTLCCLGAKEVDFSKRPKDCPMKELNTDDLLNEL